MAFLIKVGQFILEKIFFYELKKWFNNKFKKQA